MLGVYFYITDSAKTYEVATATITAREVIDIGEEQNDLYRVTLKYEDKDGVEHTGIVMDTYDSSWVVDKQVEIMYNVNDPNDVKTPSSPLVLVIMFVGLGSIAVIAGVFGIVGVFKRTNRKPNQNGEIVFANTFSENMVQNTKLYFHHTGKANQSYSVENQEGNVLFECKLLKFNLFASNLYEFVDNKTGDKQQIKVGKTITSSSSDGYVFVGDVVSSYFKIDGVNCWDYVAGRGYEIKHMMQGRTIINYQILKDGINVANIYPADIKDPFNENSINFLRMQKGYYRLEIANANLPDIVMIAFIVGRTDIVE